MLAILAVVTPVFLLVAAGYGAVRLGAFPAAGVDGLLAFVVRFATPCLLFSAMYGLDLGAAFDPGMIAAFYIGALACFAAALVLARAAGRRPGESVAIAFGAFFSNTVLIGLPIMQRAYGEAATGPMFGIIAFHAPTLYAIGMVAMEVSRQGGEGVAAALRRAGASIVRNALMIGIALGLGFNLAGLRLPAPVEDTVRLLASATLPTALFALGAALTRYRLQAEVGWAALVAGLSLVAHPAIAWALGSFVFALEPAQLRAAVVTAAMPAGLNVYVFAAMYGRAEAVAASAVLLSTALSVLTITVWLVVLGGAGGG